MLSSEDRSSKNTIDCNSRDASPAASRADVVVVCCCCVRVKGLQYGPFNRNFLDIYLPTKVKGSILTPHTQIPSADDPAFRDKHPVFIYVTGGAWIIGYQHHMTHSSTALGPFVVLPPSTKRFDTGD